MADAEISAGAPPRITQYFSIPLPRDNYEDAELKAISHLLLESKLDKLLTRSPTGSDEQRQTKKLAIEWIRQWDLEGDDIVSSLGVKGAALEHAKLQINYKRRGGWLALLAVLAVCCFFVILGLSVWANDVASEAEALSHVGDLGGSILRKKRSSAIVKTATALYAFRLSRIAFMPFDELACLKSITILHDRALHMMRVAGFQWASTSNVTFFSPRGVRLTVLRPTENTLQITMREPGDDEDTVIYDDFEPGFNVLSIIDIGLMFLAQQGLPLTVDSFKTITRLRFFRDGYYDILPAGCMEDGLAFFDGKSNMVEQTCGVAIMLLFQGSGMAEAAVGPEDYYGTRMTASEKEALSGPALYTKGDIFMSDPAKFREMFNRLVQSRIKLIQRTMP